MVEETSRTHVIAWDSLLIDRRVSSFTFDSIHRLFKRETLQTITYLSMPDSAGHQHPEKTEQNHIIETFQEDATTTTQIADTTTVNQTSHTDTTLQTDRTEETHTNRRLLPDWVRQVVGGMVVFLIMYGVYRGVRAFRKKR